MCEKNNYPSKKIALTNLNRRLRVGYKKKPVRVYYCEKDLAWHLTSKLK